MVTLKATQLKHMRGRCICGVVTSELMRYKKKLVSVSNKPPQKNETLAVDVLSACWNETDPRVHVFS